MRRHTRARLGGVEPPRGLMGQLHGIAIEADGRSRTDAGANWGDQRDRNRAVAFKIVATWDAADVRQRGMGGAWQAIGTEASKNRKLRKSLFAKSPEIGHYQNGDTPVPAAAVAENVRYCYSSLVKACGPIERSQTF